MFFPYDVITLYSREWQAYLERIPDLALCGEDVWWKQDNKGITFFNSHEEPNHLLEGCALHHFRSWTFEKEAEYVGKNWALCLERNIPIPTHILRQKEADGKIRITHTNFLKELKSCSQQIIA